MMLTMLIITVHLQCDDKSTSAHSKSPMQGTEDAEEINVRENQKLSMGLSIQLGKVRT